MKVSYNWLKEHIALDLAAKDLAPHLLQLGFEVSARERRGPAFSGVVTGQILAIDKHPNADRLSLCKVSDGARELSIVCGAKNIAVGQKVPVALIGAKLPGGREITPAKIRGVESQGMICSASELGLPGENGGIMVLPASATVGVDFSKSFTGGDDILEVEITPNRPDCLSHLGLARELSAFFRVPLIARPQPKFAVKGESWPVELADGESCPLYVGRVLSNIVVGPSPGWLAAKLEAVGLRPINNVVDVTNYMLMDIGQPMHAFDLDKLEGGKIVVRRGKKGEKLKCLDEKVYDLTPEVLVIADAKKPLAVAGVMGGFESAVSAKTTKIFLESAYFAPPAIRKSGSLLRLRSDSSYRFERGTDIEAASIASHKATELLLSLCGKSATATNALIVTAGHREKVVIPTTISRLNALLGSNFPESEVARSLQAIAPAAKIEGDAVEFPAPSWRGDLETPWDLAEEVARLIGYQNIPARAAAVPVRPSRTTPSQQLAEKLRRRLSGFGLREAYNYDFVSDKVLARCGLSSGAAPRLANPLSEDWVFLRTSLLPGLLQNAAANLNRGATNVRLFELGKVYAKGPGVIEERAHAAGILLGPITAAFWQPARVWPADVYAALGIMTDLMAGLPDITWSLRPAKHTAHASDALFHTHAWQSVGSSRGPLGGVGLLHPKIARAWDLERESAVLFYLDLERLGELSSPAKRFEPFSQFPAIRRDISILVDEKIDFARVLISMQDSGIKGAQTELIDLFTGKNVAAGKKSLTLRLTFTRMDRTLRDEEANVAIDKVLAALKKDVGAVLRS